MKKVLSMLLALVIVVTMASFPAFADGEPTKATLTFVDDKDDGTYYQTNFPFENAIDGNETSAWISDQYSGSLRNTSFYLTFELPEATMLDTLIIKWGANSQWGRQAPDAYEVYVSPDGSSWGNPILTYTDLYSLAAGTHDSVEVVSTSDAWRKINVTETGINAKNVKYIKIKVTKLKYAAAIFEIEAYTKEADDLTPATYTVKYQDTNGTEILAPETFENVYVGDNVTVKAPAIGGYLPVEESKTITLINGTNEIIFTYREATEVSYTVKYVDEEGNPVAEAKSGQAYEGDEITESPVKLIDKGLLTTDAKKTITLKAGETNEIVFTYKNVIKVKKFTATRLTASNWWNTTCVTDGLFTTNPSTLADTGAESPVAEAIFEFDKEYAFDKMTIYMNVSYAKATIYVSDDGVNWGTAYRDDTYRGEKFEDRTIYAHEIDLGGVEATYIKYEINGNSYPSFYEIAFEGKEPDHLAPIGASIRIPEVDNSASAGLRFATRVIKAKVGIEGTYVYNESDEIKFGMFLLPEDMLGTANDLEEYLALDNNQAFDIPAKKIYEQDDETVIYTAVLTDIPESAYGRKIIAIPYMLKDGNYTYFAEITRSYKNVALAARESTYSDEAIAAIEDDETRAKMQSIADGLDEIIETAVETKTVTPTANDVYSMGRTNNYNELLYAGAVYEYKCTGTVVGAEVVKAYGENVRFDVSIDGGEFVSYTLTDTNSTKLIFATDLNASKEHTVTIVRATDIWGAKLTIKNVIVDTNGDVVDNHTRDYDMKIEFIGDSITSGVKTNLFSQSYAYLTAKEFNANYNIVSRSGLGLHKNASNNTSNGMLKDLYGGIAMCDGRYQYDYNPDLVVLNIGTNDGANVRNLADDADKAAYRAEFKTKYIEMLGVIHQKNPNAIIVCTGGLMGDIANVKTQITEAVAEFKAANPDVEVYCEYLSTASDISADTSWHPGVAGHAKGAKELIAIIKNILNIQ